MSKGREAVNPVAELVQTVGVYDSEWMETETNYFVYGDSESMLNDCD